MVMVCLFIALSAISDRSAAVEAITSPATSAKLTHSDAATTPTPTSASESETTGTTPELKPTPEPIAA